MRSIAIEIATAALLCVSAGAVAQTKPAQNKVAQNKPAPPAKAPSVTTVSLPRPLLPDTFAGWVQNGKPETLSDTSHADAANAGALKEYGFTTGVTSVYEREGQKLTVKALRFSDVSGSYGAYSFYRGDAWPKEDIGTGAASNHGRVLFWKGDIVVDATFSHLSPESASELRELAAQLPALQGPKAVIPPILANLPQKNLDGQTTHYTLGPLAYAGAGGVLPPSLIGFDKGAEAVTASYGLSSGPATLTLIDYPTPQMAAAQETKIRDYIKAGASAQPAFSKPLTDSDQASLEVRRSGPVVALVSGDAIPDESHRLLGSVHYESEFVSIPQPGTSEVNKTAKLLMGLATLIVVGCMGAIALGLALGWGRAAFRIARGKPASTMYETEFTSLNLRDE